MQQNKGKWAPCHEGCARENALNVSPASGNIRHQTHIIWVCHKHSVFHSYQWFNCRLILNHVCLHDWKCRPLLAVKLGSRFWTRPNKPSIAFIFFHKLGCSNEFFKPQLVIFSTIYQCLDISYRYNQRNTSHIPRNLICHYSIKAVNDQENMVNIFLVMIWKHFLLCSSKSTYVEQM